MDLAKLGLDAVKGAGAGSVVPGVGSALGAAGGLALDLAPELGRWLFGPDSKATVKAVESLVQTATGTSEPNAQVAALTDPTVVSQLRVQLARLAAERAASAEKAAQDRLDAQLADVANARATAVQFAQAGSSMVWGAPVVSAIVLLTFGGVVALTLLRSLPPNAEPVLNVLLGTLGAMATSVVTYWVGSSAGSARKDARLATLASRLQSGKTG